ncbi:MAG: hypothetical protein GX224_02635 [Thermoplasmatales archaeon]|nr:hypothetical protein [Thermoplasmatales archaeon]
MVTPDGNRIFDVLSDTVGKRLDGKETVARMRSSGSRNWKQMEWMGFFIEESSVERLIEAIGGRVGPRYGRTGIDYMLNVPWDIKAHSKHDMHGKPISECILNDYGAIDAAVRDFGAIGFVIFLVEPEWDLSGEFKEWHDIEKGAVSEYVMDRINRGAKSRMRKSGCTIDGLLMFYLDEGAIDDGFEEGWIKGFQKGMRNADGSPRRVKLSVKTEAVPPEYVIRRCHV